MATKTTGLEFKRFYADKSIWTDGLWHEEQTAVVNGVEVNEDFCFENLADTDELVISDGVVLSKDNGELCSLESFFKKWRRAQNTETLIVTVDKSKRDAVVAAIKAAGGKVG